MTLEFCPRCGTGRTGAFRYCRSCAFDFEGPAAEATCPRCGTGRTCAFRYCRSCGLDLGDPAVANARPAAKPAMAPSPPASVPTARRLGLVTNWSAVTVLMGGGIIALGSFLPWVSATGPFVGPFSRTGLDGGGDGGMTLIAGGLVALAGIRMLARSGRPAASVLLTLAGAAIATVVVVNEMGSAQSRLNAITPAYVGAAIGVGLFVVLVGVGLSVVGLFLPREAHLPLAEPDADADDHAPGVSQRSASTLGTRPSRGSGTC